MLSRAGTAWTRVPARRRWRSTPRVRSTETLVDRCGYLYKDTVGAFVVRLVQRQVHDFTSFFEHANGFVAHAAQRLEQFLPDGQTCWHFYRTPCPYIGRASYYKMLPYDVLRHLVAFVPYEDLPAWVQCSRYWQQYVRPRLHTVHYPMQSLQRLCASTKEVELHANFDGILRNMRVLGNGHVVTGIFRHCSLERCDMYETVVVD